MALITAQEVIDYTAFDSVKSRLPAQLAFDIVQAEQDIFQFCGHDFTGENYTQLPPEVKLALIKAAEYYALVNGDESFAKGYKSEKIGDYSYQLGDGPEQRFSLTSLLAKHVQAGGKKGTTFRMRSV